jgi:hypothetical protein
MVGCFENGQSHLYGLLLGDGIGEGQVTFPNEAHTYESREAKYLGKGSRFQDRFDGKRLAKVYVQLPYRVTGIEVKSEFTTGPNGKSIRISGAIMTETGSAPTEFHVVHLDVVTPDGTRDSFHSWNLAAPEGRFDWEIPLALNAATGRWHAEFTDAATGVKKTLGFDVCE